MNIEVWEYDYYDQVDKQATTTGTTATTPAITTAFIISNKEVEEVQFWNKHLVRSN